MAKDQEDRVHNAEYGGVLADAEGQGDHHCRMQTGLFGEHAHAEAHIATPLSRETWFGVVVSPGSCRVGSAHEIDLSSLYERLGTLHGKDTGNSSER